MANFTDTASPGSSSNLYYCGATSDNSQGIWCCQSSTSSYNGFCCNDSTALFNMEPYNGDVVGDYWWNPIYSSSHLGSSASTAAPISTTKSAGSTNTTESVLSQSPSTSPKQSASSNLSTAVGAGVGVPLGILAVGVIVFLFWRERRTARKREEERRAEMEKKYSTQANEPLNSGSERNMDERAVQHPQQYSAGPNPLRQELDGPPLRELHG